MERNPIHGWRRGATLVGILVICAGTASSNRSCSFGSSGDSGDGGDDPTFVTTLQLQDSEGNVTNSFQRGESIQMILTVRNRRDTTETVEFTDSRQSDFLVVRENSSGIVWQLSEESAAPSPGQTVLELGPGETETITISWDQTESDSGERVRVGTYEARGVIVFDGFDNSPLRSSQLGSPLERFTIN
jgi:Intracellular proteinase inhibitor